MKIHVYILKFLLDIHWLNTLVYDYFEKAIQINPRNEMLQLFTDTCTRLDALEDMIKEFNNHV